MLTTDYTPTRDETGFHEFCKNLLFFIQQQNINTDTSKVSNVYWTVHHCNSWRMKDQLDVTCYFISLLMCSTCFGHYDIHHQVMLLAILFLFLCAEHVSDINISIIRWRHLLFCFTSYVLNMFRTLIYPSSGACYCVVELPHRSSCSQFVVCWRFGAAGVEWCSFCRLKPAKRAPLKTSMLST